MTHSTTLLLKFMRFFFLLITVVGGLGLPLCLAAVLFNNPQPGEVVTINVLTFNNPSPELQDVQHRTKAVEQAVAKGQPAQFLPSSRAGLMIYREANPVARVALRLIASRTQFVPHMLALTLFSLLVYLMLRVMRPGVPFTPANVRRLYWLGLLLIGCDVYRWSFSWWLTPHLAAVAPAGVTGLHPVSPFGITLVSNWMIGVLLFFVAAGYQRGVELTEDAELTV